MGLPNNENAFKTVQSSLREENKLAKKYKAYTFIDQVADEYKALLNA